MHFSRRLDYIFLELGFGASGTWANGDFNGDGLVTFKDYVILEANFGKSSVPELATMGLLVLGGLALIRRHQACQNDMLRSARAPGRPERHIALDIRTVFGLAKWIWHTEQFVDNVNNWMQARLVFRPGKRGRGSIHITADARYRLYVNGQYVCRGPARGFQDN